LAAACDTRTIVVGTAINSSAGCCSSVSCTGTYPLATLLKMLCLILELWQYQFSAAKTELHKYHCRGCICSPVAAVLHHFCIAASSIYCAAETERAAAVSAVTAAASAVPDEKAEVNIIGQV
jgi:hypothetical protein